MSSSAAQALTATRRRKSPRWRTAFIVLSVIALAVYGVTTGPEGVESGRGWGLAFGVVATALLMADMLYSIRRRTARAAPGATVMWLQAHLYGGALFCLLMLMHSGFRIPAGFVAWGMWAGSLWLLASGLLGRLIQRWVPVMLTSGLSIEVLYERIPELVEVTAERAREVAHASDETVRRFYDRTLAAALANPRARLVYLFDITGGAQLRARDFAYLRTLAGAEQRAKLDELEGLYRTKLEIDAHYTLQTLLRTWVFAHAPIAITVVVLVLFHLLSVIYY